MFHRFEEDELGAFIDGHLFRPGEEGPSQPAALYSRIYGEKAEVLTGADGL